MVQLLNFDWRKNIRLIDENIILIDNIKEASLVIDVNIFGFNKLKEVTEFLTGVSPYEPIEDIKDSYI